MAGMAGSIYKLPKPSQLFPSGSPGYWLITREWHRQTAAHTTQVMWCEVNVSKKTGKVNSRQGFGNLEHHGPKIPCHHPLIPKDTYMIVGQHRGEAFTFLNILKMQAANAYSSGKDKIVKGKKRQGGLF